MSSFRSYVKASYAATADWQFIPDIGARRQCNHVWVSEFIGIDQKFHRVERRCGKDGKFQYEGVTLCGLHTPGYGRKGSRRVPQP